MKKRKDYINWNDYFCYIALLSSMRSKDPNTQVGACIVSEDKKIIGIGYNGFPNGCSDDELPWDREGNFLDTKYPYVCHAELNAILNSNPLYLKRSLIYTVIFPCNECAKAIIQAGIKEVVYIRDTHINSNLSLAAMKMFNMCGVKFNKYEPKLPLTLM